MESPLSVVFSVYVVRLLRQYDWWASTAVAAGGKQHEDEYLQVTCWLPPFFGSFLVCGVWCVVSGAYPG